MRAAALLVLERASAYLAHNLAMPGCRALVAPGEPRRAAPARHVALPLLPLLMQIAIVGAGIVGVTTAYELAADGHQVTVFERHAAIAEEASFATGALLGPASLLPLVGVEMPNAFGHKLMRRASPIQVRPPQGRREQAWLRAWLAGSNPAPGNLARRAQLRELAQYSQQRMLQVSERLQYSFENSAGVLVLLRTQPMLEAAQQELALLHEAGFDAQLVDAEHARRIEPALNPDTELAGAVHLPRDAIANCRQFAVIVRDAAEQMGARFVFRSAVEHIEAHGGPPQLQCAGDGAARPFDAVVLCAGLASTRWLPDVGGRLALQPVYGYTLSAPIQESLNAPLSAVYDERTRVSISRLGQRVRAAGLVEVGGSATVRDEAVEQLYRCLRDWFPAAIHSRAPAQVWKDARPTTVDNLPLLGPTPLPGVWINAGHGDHGWALACGSARALADQIAGRAPEIDTDGLGLARLR